MSLPLILAPVVLTVGQLYLGQNHSAGKTVTDATSVCALSAQNHTQHRFRLIIYSCRNEYCQLPFQVFFFFLNNAAARCTLAPLMKRNSC